MLFIFLAHLVACLWWSIGRMGLPGADVGADDHSTSWILRMEARDRTQLLARNATEGAFLAILADDDAGDAAALAEAMRGSDGGALEAWHADGAQALGQASTSRRCTARRPAEDAVDRPRHAAREVVRHDRHHLRRARLHDLRGQHDRGAPGGLTHHGRATSR